MASCLGVDWVTAPGNEQQRVFSEWHQATATATATARQQNLQQHLQKCWCWLWKAKNQMLKKSNFPAQTGQLATRTRIVDSTHDPIREAGLARPESEAHSHINGSTNLSTTTILLQVGRGKRPHLWSMPQLPTSNSHQIQHTWTTNYFANSVCETIWKTRTKQSTQNTTGSWFSV